MGALFWLVADRTKLPDIGDLPTERAQDAYVDHRRSMTAQEVLADYESVSSAAIPILGSLIGQTFEVPLGDLGTYRQHPPDRLQFRPLRPPQNGPVRPARPADRRTARLG